jgi:glycosyltransferase involved in cell wall biosynthesis
MDRRKGYAKLLDAYLSLPADVRGRLRLDFAGRFEDPAEQAEFEQRISESEDITYHGVVDGHYKRDLFAKAHVFCLPTAYLEGQPLTILEDYASGCVVLTTPQPGILDVFEPGVNGQLISTNDTSLLQENLATIAADSSRFLDIALNNFDEAMKNYRPNIFCERMNRILVDRSSDSKACTIP